MTEVIECPGCRRRLQLPVELSDRLVQCPKCAETFVAALPEQEPPLVDVVDAEEIDGPVQDDMAPAPDPAIPLNLSLDPPGSSSRPRGVPPPPQPLKPIPVALPGEKPPARRDPAPFFCPDCGERVPRHAERCRYCGTILGSGADDDEPPPRRRGRRDLEPHRGGLILTLGILGIVGVSCWGVLGLPFGIAAWVMGQTDIQKMDAHLMDRQGRGTTNAGRVCGIVGTILDSLVLCLVGMAFLSR